MRKKIFQVGNALLLSALLAAPAVADSFKSDIFCGPPLGARGQVKISDKGNVSINVDGLFPHLTYACDVECEIFGEDFIADCESDGHGRISATFKNAVEVCIGPVVEIEFADEIICASGVVSSELLH